MKISKISRLFTLHGFVLGAVLMSASAHGATVIFSEGFESTGVADGAFVGDWDGPNGTVFSLSNTNLGNLLNPQAIGATSSWLNPVPSSMGLIFATLHSGATATGNTGQTFTSGYIYTFTFTHFRRDDIVGDSVRASIGNTSGALASSDFAGVTTTDVFETRTVNYTATPADNGQNIVLRFRDFNGGVAIDAQAGIDNIELSVAVPEPSTSLLGGLSVLALLRRRR